MIYQIHEITAENVTGSVIDMDWIVVADIPRKMVKYNRVKPKNISLVSHTKFENQSDDFEDIWTKFMADRLRNWIIRNHPEKLFPYKDQPVGIMYDCD